MQTIATSLTSRQGVFVKNLTVATVGVVVDREPLVQLALRKLKLNGLARRDREKISQLPGEDETFVERQQARTALYEEAGYDFPCFLNGVEKAMFLHPTIDPVVPVLTQDPWPTKDVQPSTLLIIYGDQETKSSLFKDIQNVSTVITKDHDFKIKQDEAARPLMVYYAENSEDMIELIKAAIKVEIPVHFMGVGLMDIKVFDKEDVNQKFTNFLVQSKVEAMIESVMIATTEFKQSKTTDHFRQLRENAEAEEQSKTSSLERRNYAAAEKTWSLEWKKATPSWSRYKAKEEPAKLRTWIEKLANGQVSQHTEREDRLYDCKLHKTSVDFALELREMQEFFSQKK